MDGVVGCAAYSGGRRVADLSLDDLTAAAAREDWFVWVGLHEPAEDVMRRVQEVFHLHDLAVEDALRAHQRPKLEEYADGLFVVLRTVQREPKGATKQGETHLFVGPRYLVSIRHGASASYAAVRTRCESTPHLLAKGPEFVLYAIMDFVVDGYFPVVEVLEEEIVKLEQHLFDEVPRRGMVQRIYRLKRELLVVKRGVLPMVDVCNRLLRFDATHVHDDCRPYFRDVYDHVMRINERVDGLRELLTSALEANLSLVSVRQNDIMKQLAGWAAILGVPTMIAGVYGMNFKDMPELEWRYGYPFVWLVMIGAAATLYASFKRRGWL